MNQEIINQVLDIFNNLGKLISDGAKAVFEIYTRQSFAEGIASIGISLILIIVMGVIIKVGIHFYRKDEYDKSYPVVITGMLIFPLFIIACIGIHDGILKIINPQYYAIQKVVNQVGGK